MSKCRYVFWKITSVNLNVLFSDGENPFTTHRDLSLTLNSADSIRIQEVIFSSESLYFLMAITLFAYT